MTKVLPCPFCGSVPDIEDPDCIYPIGRAAYNDKTNLFEYKVYNFVCYEAGGGCGASILGDSREDCIKKWNTRFTT